MARVSKLANPEFAAKVAELYAAGVSRPEMAKALGAHPDTITDWVKDVRVQAHVNQFISERANRVLRITDRKILSFVEDADEAEDVETLLKIRKLFTDSLPNTPDKDDSAQTVSDLTGALEENPELAQALQQLTGVQNVKK